MSPRHFLAQKRSNFRENKASRVFHNFTLLASATFDTRLFSSSSPFEVSTRDVRRSLNYLRRMLIPAWHSECARCRVYLPFLRERESSFPLLLSSMCAFLCVLLERESAEAERASEAFILQRRRACKYILIRIF